MRNALTIFLCLSLFGCAAVFRGTKDHVQIESSPEGAEAMIRSSKSQRPLGPTPAVYDVPRQGATYITLTKDGYDDHHGAVKKKMNAGWLALDLLTCIPLACIPLLVDGITGAWFDVEKRYVAAMKPGSPGGTVAAAAAGGSRPIAVDPAAPSTTAPPDSSPAVELSESERKATARAAYMEGVSLQDRGNCIDALARFEVAQKFYPAPTHLLHIGQCQAATGKLVEAFETFEMLTRTSLTKESPDAFHDAQQEGKKQLAQLKPRIPTLRIRTVPAPQALTSVVVKLNGRALPKEVLGIARPVNPGRYTVTVWAAGYTEAVSELDIGEGVTKALEMKLAK